MQTHFVDSLHVNTGIDLFSKFALDWPKTCGGGVLEILGSGHRIGRSCTIRSKPKELLTVIRLSPFNEMGV